MSTCCGWACVQQSNVGIVERFGEFSDVIPPGCTFVGCLGNVRGEVSLRTRLMHVDGQGATEDRVMVSLRVSVLFSVIPSECHTAYYSLSSLTQIRSYVENALRGEIARVRFDMLFVCKQQIAAEVRRHVQPELAHRGFEVHDLLISKIIVPHDVRNASEQQLVNRYMLEANTHRAEAMKLETRIRAEAAAEVKRLEGVGSANEQMGIAAGFGALMDRFKAGEQTSEIMAMILMQQYFDTLGMLSKAPGVHTIFEPHRSLIPRMEEIS
jgi:regulator of protease activity HflC (stomatin/prohibitin superfamily)